MPVTYRAKLLLVLPFAVQLGCSSGNDAASDAPPPSPTHVGPDSGAGVDGGGVVGNPDSGAPRGADADAVSQPDAGGFTGPWNAGNPDAKCAAAIPAEGRAANVGSPTTIVGTGTPASCTFAALSAAVAKGGIITFDCGSAPVTIPMTATMKLPINKDTVIDGGRKVTLDGGRRVQILRFESPNFRALDTRVTLQHIRLVNGKTAGSSPIPPAPAPCSEGFNAGEGGAIYMRDGNLSVIDSIFESNSAALLGPDVGGGAIRVLGSKHGVIIVASTFKSNAASNGGAVGCLFAELDVYDSLFENNIATGHDANNDDATKCSVINNGQHEIGSGGNGGALYSDGASVDVTLCGDKIVGNAAGTNAFGGGLFFTSNDFGGTLTIADTTMTGNTGGYWTQVRSGAVSNAGTAIGTNAKSITITNSKLQGIP